MRKETNGRSANRQDGQRRWLGRAWRGGSERQGRQSRRATGAGGRRDAEAVLPPPPPRCPGRSTSLISHLAAPGPVCAEPGIPPAAQIAPAPSLPPPRFPVPARPQEPGRPAAEPGPILGPDAHSWPRLDGAPRARARGGRGRGPADGAPKARARGARTARAPEQCGHRGTWRGLPSDGGQFLVEKPDAAGGGGGVQRLGGRAGEPFRGTGRKRVAAGGVAGC